MRVATALVKSHPAVKSLDNWHAEAISLMVQRDGIEQMLVDLYGVRESLYNNSNHVCEFHPTAQQINRRIDILERHLDRIYKRLEALFQEHVTLDLAPADIVCLIFPPTTA